MVDEDEEKDMKTLSAVDVIVPCFSITAPHRVLFKDAKLKLVKGRRYGLIGPNGYGKSTLLKFICSRRMPVPEGVSVFLLDQEFPASAAPVVEQVLAADEKRAVLMAEEATLLDALDSDGGGDGGDDGALAQAVERLQRVGAELDAMGAYGCEAKVRSVLTGLGFTEAMQDSASTTLSGGWRVRV